MNDRYIDFGNVPDRGNSGAKDLDVNKYSKVRQSLKHNSLSELENLTYP